MNKLIFVALALPIVASAGCFPDKSQNQGRAAGEPKPGGSGPQVHVDQTPQRLEGVRVVQPAQRPGDDGGLVVSVGRIEMRLPPGWSSMSFGGQTTFRSPDFQEQLHIQGFVAEQPMDAEKQKAVLGSLLEISSRGEHMVERFGAHVKLSPPVPAATSWGETARFSAIGPLNRVAFHFVAVAKGEALNVQLDGNTMSNSPQHAIALIESVRYAQEAASTK